jgi:serine/threonine protein kinase
VARGLGYAHSYGGLHLVHRDIAPPNILCSWQGEVKITDFGLASSRIKSERTGPGIVLGRLGYLAPEQARGEPADHRTDIYALGVVLWELLTGRPLLNPLMDPAEALRVIRALRPEPPSRHAADLPASLDRLVLRAIAPERPERYQSADELRQELSRELLRLQPDADASCVVAFLRGLYGDEIEAEQAEHERLLREELPRARAPREPAPAPPLLGLTGLRAQIAARYIMDQVPPPAEEEDPGSPAAARRRLHQVIDGRYRIDRLIGLGGMGAVYEAEHVAIRRKVALKVLHRDLSRKQDLVMRFRREAQAASRVGHPNIVDITDFGYTQDGSAFLVMEHLSGLDLAQVLAQRGRLRPQRALHVALQLVQALSAAHNAGVIHRDLKPENIFLLFPEETIGPDKSGPRDIVKVLDFGIAMRVEPTVPIRLTSPGLTVGTPEYMSPEQATGEGTDGRADIYAVGTILYEMLGGRVPFEDLSPVELLQKKASEPARPLHDLEPGVHPALEQVIMQCLERAPSARPQSMGELLRALLRVQAELSAPPPLPRIREAMGGAPSPLSLPPPAAPSCAATCSGRPPPGCCSSAGSSCGPPGRPPLHHRTCVRRPTSGPARSGRRRPGRPVPSGP